MSSAQISVPDWDAATNTLYADDFGITGVQSVKMPGVMESAPARGQQGKLRPIGYGKAKYVGDNGELKLLAGGWQLFRDHLFNDVTIPGNTLPDSTSGVIFTLTMTLDDGQGDLFEVVAIECRCYPQDVTGLDSWDGREPVMVTLKLTATNTIVDGIPMVVDL